MKTLQNCGYSTEKKELQKLFLQTLKRYTGFSTKDETVEKLSQSSMPNQLAPDPVRVQPCVWCLF